MTVMEINDEMVAQGQQRIGNYYCMCISNVAAALDEFSDHALTFEAILDAIWFIRDIVDGCEATSIFLKKTRIEML